MQSSETIHPEKHHLRTPHTEGRVITAISACRLEGNAVVLETAEATIQVLFVDGETVRVRVHRDRQLTLSATPAVVQDVQTGKHVDVTDGEEDLLLRSSKLTARIVKRSFSMQIVNERGTVIFDMVEIECPPSGKTVCHVRCSPEDHFYGLGEKTSFLDKRGEYYRMWNSDIYAPHNPEIEALYVSVPFLIHKCSRGACGVFLDNPGETAFDMRTNTDSYSLTTSSGDLDLYVLNGPSLKDVVARYTALTGRMALPPAWALGYHQSRYSYMDEHEVKELAETFRSRDIPCDAIHFDIHYMSGYRVFTFDEARFPQPKQLVGELLEQGFHVVPIVDPGVKKDATYRPYVEGVKQDMFCKYVEGEVYKGDVWPGESVFPDFTDEKVRTWWGDLHQFYTDLGIKGIWNDMNEPAVFNETKTMDVSVMHRNDGYLKTHGELHNLYGLLMSQATVDGLCKQLGNERPFLLTRAGYAGVGRLAAVWTGDNRSFWEHMSMAIPMVLNMGMSGIPFAGPDVGGFAHSASGELLARWTQMGAFFPFFRNHSALDTRRQEPWAFTKEIEDVIRRYIRMRYRYIPHLYTLFREASLTGLPPIRSLVMEYPDDANAANLSDQFLVGTSLLCAPVLQPDMRKRLVYLPAGRWQDYHTGQAYAGNQHIIADAPLDTMPMYVLAGSILARHNVSTHVDFRRVERLSFDVYGCPEDETDYHLYEDDGLSYDYVQGQYNDYHLQVHKTEDGLDICGQYVHHGYTAAYTCREICLKGIDFEQVDIQGMDRVQFDVFEQCSRAWTVAGKGDIMVRLPASEDQIHLRVTLK